jgi:nitrate/nitrite transport system ATP-binding protein
MAFIEASNLSKSFASSSRVRHVLERVSLSVERGEFVSVVGFMGCGKSTLLNILCGVLKPDAGHITIDGEEVDGVSTRASIVFQNYSLLPWFSALENVRLAVQAACPDKSRAEQRAQAERYLGMVGLGGALHRRPSQLSGGMRQRVAIARAFATHPEVLFLDEPFGALDALTRGNLQQELARLCQPGGGAESSAGVGPVTTVMITNNLEEALLLSDRIIPMTRGPRATLGVPVTVELPRPRTAAQLMHDELAIRARAHVVESLTDQLESARAHTRRAAAEPEIAPAFAAREAEL